MAVVQIVSQNLSRHDISFTGKNFQHGKIWDQFTWEFGVLPFICLVLQECVYKLFPSSAFNDKFNFYSLDVSHDKYHG